MAERQMSTADCLPMSIQTMQKLQSSDLRSTSASKMLLLMRSTSRKVTWSSRSGSRLSTRGSFVTGQPGVPPPCVTLKRLKPFEESVLSPARVSRERLSTTKSSEESSTVLAEASSSTASVSSSLR